MSYGGVRSNIDVKEEGKNISETDKKAVNQIELSSEQRAENDHREIPFADEKICMIQREF